MKFVKVIYFDESSVADFMQVTTGGELKKTIEFITNIKSDLDANASAGIAVDSRNKGVPKLFSFLSGISFNAGLKGNAEINRKNEKIAKNILENTLLADFLDLLDNDEKNKNEERMCSAIKLFDKISLYPEANSFSFLMLTAPFFTMIDGDVPISDGEGSEFKIDISKIEEAIARGRGYYEFIANYKEKNFVFRFNGAAFRNNYTMSDLPKMQLSLYAVCVGKTDKERLDLAREFEFGSKEGDRVSYIENAQTSENNMMEVYDVMLAGITEV